MSSYYPIYFRYAKLGFYWLLLLPQGLIVESQGPLLSRRALRLSTVGTGQRSVRPSVEFPIFTPHSPTFRNHAHQTPLPHHYHRLPLRLQTRNVTHTTNRRKMATRLPLHARFHVDERPQRPGVLGWQLPPFLSVLSRFQCMGAYALGTCYQ